MEDRGTEQGLRAVFARNGKAIGRVMKVVGRGMRAMHRYCSVGGSAQGCMRPSFWIDSHEQAS